MARHKLTTTDATDIARGACARFRAMPIEPPQPATKRSPRTSYGPPSPR